MARVAECVSASRAATVEERTQISAVMEFQAGAVVGASALEGVVTYDRFSPNALPGAAHTVVDPCLRPYAAVASTACELMALHRSDAAALAALWPDVVREVFLDRAMRRRSPVAEARSSGASQLLRSVFHRWTRRQLAAGAMPRNARYASAPPYPSPPSIANVASRCAGPPAAGAERLLLMR